MATPTEQKARRIARQIVDSEEEPYNAAEDTVEGETLDDWMARKDEEEGRKHDDNDSRHPNHRWIEEYDPHLGVN